MPHANLKPDGYLPRIVDEQVAHYLRVFGAVEVAGAKWCGKTWTALAHGSSVSYVENDLGIAKEDPSLMLLGERPHVVDEWQLAPSIWDAVRHGVDAQRGLRGGWILTGSSTPASRGGGEDAPKHSGAGRIGRVRMLPMSLAESGESACTVSLACLFEGEFTSSKVPSDTLELVRLACRGGWPEGIDLDAEDAQLLARDYLRLLFSESVPRHGKDGRAARKLVASLARNLGQSPTYKTILADMYGEEDEPGALMSEATLASYLDLLNRLYLTEEVEGWVPPRRSRKRLSVKPKRYFADPSLAVATLGMSPQSLLDDWQTFGLVFENLCMRDLMVYARALPLAGDVPVRYYRDDAGLEADAIVELADVRWAAFEFKVGESKAGEGVASLKRLRKKVSENPKARTSPPEFLAVIAGVSEYARKVEDGVYVIPLRALCA